MSKWPYNTARWQRLRREKFREHPLCQSCLQWGKLTVATVVDHHTPISAGGEPFPALEELVSLCESCNNTKTRAEHGETNWLHKGCDIFGYPLDPAHPWYHRGKKA